MAKYEEPKFLTIVFGVGFYYPDSYGGTEAYVHTLALHLHRLGHRCIVIAPTASIETRYFHEGIEVIRFVFGSPSRDEIIGLAPVHNLEAVAELVRSLQPDVFHLHSLTSALGLPHLYKIKELGIATVFTGHVPGVVCPRGDMLHMGTTPCDGVVEWKKCTRCLLNQKGLSTPIGALRAALVSPFRHTRAVQRYLPLFHVPQRFLEAFQQLDQGADHTIAVCQWLAEALQKNGIPSKSLSIVRQAIAGPAHEKSAPERKPEKIRLGFIGRIAPVKGLHELLEAFTAHSFPHLHLSIVGSANAEHASYHQALLAKTEGFSNITWEGSLAGAQKQAWFQSLDLLCIPSIWLETGPIVALEALVEGIPLLGRNLGGLKELVVQNQQGYLYNSQDELSDYLQSIENQGRGMLPNLAAAKLDILSPEQQAAQMLAIYYGLLQANSVH